MPAPIRAVLFDKDGTLVDFHATWIPVYRDAAEKLAAQAGEPDLAGELLRIGGYDEQTGRCAPQSPLASGTASELARLWGPVAGADDLPRLAASLNAQFYDHVTSRPIAATPLAPLFARLRAGGLQLGVATMDTEACAHTTMENLGVRAEMSFLCGYDSGFGEKPGPGMVEAFSEHISVGVEHIAVVGDTPHDLNMARAAGARLAVGVLTGASLHHSLAPLADVVLDSIADLEAVVLPAG
ncbi:MAG: HAD family hydrolase [Gammaproteobacteria bacterium]